MYRSLIEDEEVTPHESPSIISIAGFGAQKNSVISMMSDLGQYLTASAETGAQKNSVISVMGDSVELWFPGKDTQLHNDAIIPTVKLETQKPGNNTACHVPFNTKNKFSIQVPVSSQNLRAETVATVC